MNVLLLFNYFKELRDFQFKVSLIIKKCILFCSCLRLGNCSTNVKLMKRNCSVDNFFFIYSHTREFSCTTQAYCIMMALPVTNVISTRSRRCIGFFLLFSKSSVYDENGLRQVSIFTNGYRFFMFCHRMILSC